MTECEALQEQPDGATHMRRPEYLTAWLFDRVAVMPIWLIEHYKSEVLPERKIGHYATAIDGEFWKWFDPAKFEELFMPAAPPASPLRGIPEKLTGELACILENCSPPEKQTDEAVAALILSYQATWDRIMAALSASPPEQPAAYPSAEADEEHADLLRRLAAVPKEEK